MTPNKFNQAVRQAVAEYNTSRLPGHAPISESQLAATIVTLTAARIS